MRTGLAATVAVLLIPLLAGCAADEGAGAGGGQVAVPEGVPPARLEPGRFYAFRHGGGALTFRLDGEGDAAFGLYGGDDERLGSVGFSSGPARSGLHRIDGVAAGDVVLHLATLNGTLRVESGGHAVQAFRPLAEHLERVLLANQPGRASPLGPFGIPVSPTAQPADATVEVALRRAPATLRLLGTGPWQNLSVEVRSASGLVLRTQPNPAPPFTGLSLGPSGLLGPVAADATPQNARDGQLTARVRADDLAGPIVLEARSYSRAELPGPAAAGPNPRTLPFSYGALPDGPVAFAVHPSARRLVLWQEGAGANATDAAVALFGPHDERLGVVLVPATGSAAVATAGAGDYVAVLLAGQATLGAERAPADFQLRPLTVRETVAPAERAGGNREYGLAGGEAEAAHAFALRPAEVAASGDGPPTNTLGSCDAGRFLAASQGGETVLASIEPTDQNLGIDAAPFLAASLALRDGPLVLAHDGFGDDGCPRPALAILSYERP